MPGKLNNVCCQSRKAKLIISAASIVIWVPDEGLLAAAGDEQVHATQRLSSLDDFKPEEWGLPAYDEF